MVLHAVGADVASIATLTVIEGAIARRIGGVGQKMADWAIVVRNFCSTLRANHPDVLGSAGRLVAHGLERDSTGVAYDARTLRDKAFKTLCPVPEGEIARAGILEALWALRRFQRVKEGGRNAQLVNDQIKRRVFIDGSTGLLHLPRGLPAIRVGSSPGQLQRH